MKPKVEPTVEKWEEILKKAEKYVRANSVYYGNDQYRLSMTDWLYFIKGVANEVEAHSVQEAKAERDREWMVGMYQMFGNSKGGRVGMTILSTLNTKGT